MSKKSKKNDKQGTYALCITVGLFVGIGLGPFFGNLPVSAAMGAFIGAGAGYYFTHIKKNTKR